jgi:hypothetical protein
MEGLFSAICSSIMRRTLNYLIDYAFVYNAELGDQVAQLMGLMRLGARLLLPINAVAFVTGLIILSRSI